MAYQFSTHTGACYKVADGRISRLTPSIPFHNNQPAPIIYNQMVDMVRPPKVGDRCVFYTPFHTDGVTTGVVKSVTPL